MGREQGGARDKVRQAWYARHRQRRFARFLGFDDKTRDAASRPRPAPGPRLSRMTPGPRPHPYGGQHAPAWHDPQTGLSMVGV